MDKQCCSEFQATVDNYLIRHRSVLDVITKFQESNARVNRAFAKAVTECGCMQIHAVRQQIPSNIHYSQLKDYMASHIDGQPCSQCQEILATELGRNLFYLAALCNLIGLDLNDVMQQEHDRVKTLGVFHLS